jgi:hypothetical protein
MSYLRVSHRLRVENDLQAKPPGFRVCLEKQIQNAFEEKGQNNSQQHDRYAAKCHPLPRQQLSLVSCWN